MIRNDVPLLLDSPRAWRTYIGGALLDRLHGRIPGEDSNFPEEWIMSVVAARNVGREDIKDEGMSRLAENGGVTLKELIDSNPAYYLGEAHGKQFGAQPGVLVKLIDSAERLTVQVHPDRETAKRLFQSPFGKTECWHILDTRPGVEACVYMGFQRGITKEGWKKLFDAQDIPGMLGCMHRISVKKGDTILISGGIPHAIGAGCFLVEIQEPTDYTIRVEKHTPSGLEVADSMCHQGLGFEKMFDCFHYEGVTEEEAKRRWFVPAISGECSGQGSCRILLGYDTVPMFCLEEIWAEGSLALPGSPDFSGLYILSGTGTMSAAGGECRLEAGQQYFVPCRTGGLHFEAEEGQPLRIFRFKGPKAGASADTALDCLL